MFGMFGFIIALGLSNLFLIIAIGAIVFTHQKKRKIPWATVIKLLIAQVIISYFSIPIYYHQLENYFFIRTITAREVSSIQVESTTWTVPQDIEAIINCFNQAVWYERVKGNKIGSLVTMTITLQSGKVWKSHIGRYPEKDGAIFEFFHPMNAQGAYWNDGTAYVPGLTTILENIDYSLPR